MRRVFGAREWLLRTIMYMALLSSTTVALHPVWQAVVSNGRDPAQSVAVFSLQWLGFFGQRKIGTS